MNREGIVHWIRLEHRINDGNLKKKIKIRKKKTKRKKTAFFLNGAGQVIPVAIDVTEPAPTAPSSPLVLSASMSAFRNRSLIKKLPEIAEGKEKGRTQLS